MSGVVFVRQIDCSCKAPCGCLVGGKHRSFISKFDAVAPSNSTKVAQASTIKDAYEVIHTLPTKAELEYGLRRFTLITAIS